MRSTSASGLLVVSHVGLDRERLVVVEALDRFGVGLDQQLGELRDWPGSGSSCDQVAGGGVDIVVLGEVRQGLVAGLLQPK